MARRVAIVPHTHWDREWYEPFQTFRMDLVDTLDTLLSLLESDPSYSRFLLDGQMAVIDDYLEIRPEAADRIVALAASGRLTMGPWYILMDEFLVSGETIVRNLQAGMRRGAEFGGVMPVGYLPDMFGHIAQMPQILRLAGIDQAVVWRGVPSSITKTGFFWEALDGSTVRAEYLPVGYSNGGVLPDDGKSLVRRIEDHWQEISTFLDDELLVMNGSDHLRPQPGLGRVVAEANALQDDFEFTITSLPEYLASARTEGLEHWKGELRSGARANVLMGVTSNRVDVKRSAALAERSLERRAEPYAALYLPDTAWPGRLFELAWKGMLHNSAHDSICACSLDEVVDAVRHRYAESRQIAEGIAERALRNFTRSLAEPGPVVLNPSARSRDAMVEVVVTAEEPAPPHVQVISERFGLPGSMTLDADTVRTVLGMLQGPKIDSDTWVQEVGISEDETGIDVTVTVGAHERPGVAIAEAKQDLYTRLGARPSAPVRVKLDQPPIRRVAARVRRIAGFGWSRFEPAELRHPVRIEEGSAGQVALTNDLVRVEVDPEEGTYSIGGTPGFGLLVDGGDLGDSYNYSPPRVDSVVERPKSVEVALAERGPVRARVNIVSRFDWPDHVDGPSQARVGEQSLEVTSTVELRADEGVVRVDLEFVNPSRDHRLRIHLPLPERARSSRAECAYGVVERGLEVQGRPEELGVPTFPSRRFVVAGGLTVVHEGLNEYELVDIDEAPEGRTAGTLALTVLRSTGMLSRLGMAYRPFPAGPLVPVPGLQLLGQRIQARYAVALGPVDPWQLADDVLLPLDVVHAPGGGTRPPSGRQLEIEGAEVTALRREAATLEVRVCNPTPEPTTVRTGERSGWLVSLQGQPLEPFDGSFVLRPFGIATIRLPGA